MSLSFFRRWALDSQEACSFIMSFSCFQQLHNVLNFLLFSQHLRRCMTSSRSDWSFWSAFSGEHLSLSVGASSSSLVYFVRELGRGLTRFISKVFSRPLFITGSGEIASGWSLWQSRRGSFIFKFFSVPLRSDTAPFNDVSLLQLFSFPLLSFLSFIKRILWKPGCNFRW